MNAIEINGVTVAYRTHWVRSLKELMVHRRPRTQPAYVYGLQDISMMVRTGESVGVVGDNGAGKSTLLRVAAGIITPSRGSVLSRGRIAPLIELGAGFEAELSGRENVFFNGALLGRSRKQMRRRLEEIVSFSGLEPFIDLPLRTYSTGMVSRLAFSVAMTVEAETLLLDEILAVGDAAFRQRCEERIRTIVRSGATTMIVSHDLETVQALCGRALWVRHGRIALDGPARTTIDAYRANQFVP